MSEQIRMEGPDDDGVVVVWIDQPGKKVNVLNTNSIPEFTSLMDEILRNKAVKAVVIASGKENCFIAGADIDMLNEITTAEGGAEIAAQGQAAMNKLANLSVPTVAAIHGDCLGGGLELALACSARIATDSPRTKLALPEVMLGLLPGAGGTRRLPRLIGLPDALDMMLTGRNIRPKKALKLGLVDKVVPQTWLVSEAKKLALSLSARRKPMRRKRSFQETATRFAVSKIPPVRNKVYAEAQKTVLEKSFGLYPAPLKILEVVKADSDQAEAAGFGELLVTPESQGLRHLFQCITALKKDDGPNTEEAETFDVSRVGMLGAGLMGGGIATVLADKEIQVRLKDINWNGIEAALGYARAYFSKAVKRKRYPEAGMHERMNRLSGTLEYTGFGLADVVIEAVPESLELKQSMLREVEERAKRPAIFATNTSSLPITEIAAKAKHPERVVGMHFFSPVEKMPLVEIIVTKDTDPKVTKTISQLARKMGKHVIVVNDCAGFYTTRALAPYMSEAIFMLLEGYDVRDIDLAAQEAGFPVGPITLMDEVGIDVGAKITKIMKQYYGDRMEFPDSGTTDAFIAEGRFGRKANKGFYVYEDGKSKMEEGQKVVDESCLRYLPKGISPKAANQKHRVYMADRLKLAFVNEAAYCLQEGVLREPRAGDLGAIMGIGFPPFTGGPFNYIDQIGISKIVDDLREFAQNHGSRFAPCPLLVELAEQGRKIYGTVMEEIISETSNGVPPPQTEEVSSSEPDQEPASAPETSELLDSSGAQDSDSNESNPLASEPTQPAQALDTSEAQDAENAEQTLSEPEQEEASQEQSEQKQDEE